MKNLKNFCIAGINQKLKKLIFCRSMEIIFDAFFICKITISHLFKNCNLCLDFFCNLSHTLGDGLRCRPLQASKYQRLVLGLHPCQDAAHQPARRRHPRPRGQRVGGLRSQGTAPAGRVHVRGRPRGGALHGRHWRQVAWHELSWAPPGRLRGFAPDQYSVCEEQQPWPPDTLEHWPPDTLEILKTASG